MATDFLINKKVLIFDTETTGLPSRKPNGKFGTRSEYYSPDTHSAYDNSRIVSIAWYYTNNYQKDQLNPLDIQHYIRKPEGFTEIPTTHIHGISYDEALKTGIPFIDILKNTTLEVALTNCDYILAHNVLFDIHILINELYRCEELELANKINTMLDNKQCICTGELGKPICKMQFKNSTNANSTRYKMPKLCEFYMHVFGKEMENAHNAAGDVKALVDILNVI